MLLLVVDRHEILHVHGVLPLLVGPDADGGQTKQNAGNESQSHSNPCNNVRPVILELGPGLQFLKKIILILAQIVSKCELVWGQRGIERSKKD